jgi:hypothetical protein
MLASSMTHTSTLNRQAASPATRTHAVQICNARCWTPLCDTAFLQITTWTYGGGRAASKLAPPHAMVSNQVPSSV